MDKDIQLFAIVLIFLKLNFSYLDILYNSNPHSTLILFIENSFYEQIANI